MKRLLLFGVLTPILSGAAITPIITFSNFTSSIVLSSPYIDSVVGFSQGSHYVLPPGQGMWGPIAPNDVQVWFNLGGGGTLRSTTIAQRVDATASLDFVLSGYQTSRIDIYGAARDDGMMADERHGISGPCAAWISGSDNNWAACSSPGAQSGTITAMLSMYTEASPPYRADTGTLAGLSVLMTLTPLPGDEGFHTPEPAVYVMVGGGLIGLSLMFRARNRT